jgi:hypothetical protein
LPNFSTAAMDRHSFSATSRGDDREDLFESTTFTARAGDLGRSAAVFGVCFAVRAAWHSLMVEHAGNCGRQRLRISRRNVSDEVAPSMPRKLRVIHPSSSTRASSRFGVFSSPGIPSDVRSAKLPRIVAGIMHPPSRQRIIADRSAIRIAQSGRSQLDCGEIEPRRYTSASGTVSMLSPAGNSETAIKGRTM